MSKKAKPSSTKGLALRSMPQLYARGVQFDTSLREKCFLRRTRRRRKRLKLFFRWVEKTLRGFFDSLKPYPKRDMAFYFIKGEADFALFPRNPKPKPSAKHGFGLAKAEQGSERSFRQKAKPGAGNGVERTLFRRHPQSAVSMGIICFFRLITLGRKI